MGTGPFRLARLNTFGEILLVRNARYWEMDNHGVRLPYVSAARLVVMATIDDGISIPRVDGQIISCVPASGEAWLRRIEAYNHGQSESRQLRLVKTPIANTIFFAFRMDANNPWASSKLLRQAVAHAFDMSFAITSPLLVIPEKSLIPPGLFGYHSSVPGYEYNLHKAVALLQEAGFPHGHALPPLKLNSIEATGPFYKKLRDSIDDNLAKVASTWTGAEIWSGPPQITGDGFAQRS